jgi:hypothetical protein
VVSATDPHGRILSFLDRSKLFIAFYKIRQSVKMIRRELAHRQYSIKPHPSLWRLEIISSSFISDDPKFHASSRNSAFPQLHASHYRGLEMMTLHTARNYYRRFLSFPFSLFVRP